MSQPPQRPYVPHRTPTRAQPAVSFADFTLAKPFVPDVERMRNVTFEAASNAVMQSDSTLPAIDSFLAVAQVTAPAQAAELSMEEFADEPEELPPLEHFLDPLPPVADFSASEAQPDGPAVTEFPGDGETLDAAPAPAEADWVETDWQRYDWQSVAALGEADKAQADASNAWAATDWEVPAPRRQERTTAPADAIATALDKIAERIRNGDFSVPGAPVAADPATIAATLAALLGVRR